MKQHSRFFSVSGLSDFQHPTLTWTSVIFAWLSKWSEPLLQ